MTLAGKTILITGSSRGIGRAIALRCAADGAQVVITGKTSVPHPRLQGTIHTVAEEVEGQGGKALAIQVDVRYEDQVQAMVDQVVATFGGIDALVNNAGAISLTPTEQTTMKRFDLMHGVNARGVFLCSQKCVPHLRKALNPHILNLSPPLNLNPKWLAMHCAYTLSKYGMTLCTIGMAAEFKEEGIAVNSLWPRTAIATAAVEMLGGEMLMQASRTPEIMADAAYGILCSPSRELTGEALIDEDFLRSRGMNDFEKYRMSDAELLPDFFLD